MTSRGLSAWFAIGFCVLAVLVAADRPHWFGLPPSASLLTREARAQTVAATDRSAPWRITRARAAER